MLVQKISEEPVALPKLVYAYLSGFLKPGGEIRIYELRKSNRFLAYFLDKHRMSVEELRHAADGTGLAVKEVVEKNGFVRGTYVKKKLPKNR